MRNFFLFLIVLVLQFSIATSQTLQWAKQFGGIQVDIATSNAIDQAGNIYVTGFTEASSPDCFIYKIDSNGVILWNKLIGGPGVDGSYEIVCDNNSNIYISGYFGDSVDFDPGPGVTLLKSQSTSSAFLLKLDSAGNFIWVKVVSGSEFSYDRGTSCVVSDGNVFWAGIFSDTLHFIDITNDSLMGHSKGISDVFIAKLDGSGNLNWIKTFGGGDEDYVNSINLNSSGDILLVGESKGLCDFIPDTVINYDLLSYGYSDIYICELDSGGNFAWAKQLGGANYSIGSNLTIDNLDNIYGIGYFIDTLDADPSANVFNLISNGLTDVCLFKLDNGGNLIWAKSWGSTGSDEGMGIVIDSVNNIYTTGAFNDTVDFDPGTSIYNLTSTGGVNTFISKLDSAGNFIWANQIKGSNNIGLSIKLDAHEKIYVAGEFGGTCDFDPSNNLYNLTSAGMGDAYIFKWSQPITGLYDNYTNTLIKVFPNPFTETVQINVIEKATVTISSITGQVILRTILPVGINTIDMASQKSGTYLLNVLTDKSSSNAMVVKSD